MLELIRPDWPAPDNIRAFTTSRNGGFSEGPWSSFNLGENCDDCPGHVRQNRELLRTLLPSEPPWLQQVHGNHVAHLSGNSNLMVEADASVTTELKQVCAILTADCLPVLFCNKAGTIVAAAHAGWRGLAAGVLDATVTSMDYDPGKLIAWLGPAIGPKTFEVGQDVYHIFVNLNPRFSVAFKKHGDHWLADLYKLARLALDSAGVGQISGGKYCTFTEKKRFFSHRRDGVTGRMATVIWLDQ